jgi:SynChlorMet cassette radical SAM/SPASM protein ScmF
VSARLETLYFHLTEGCNLACRHCWVAPSFDPAGDRSPSLPVALFETAIREAVPLGLRGVKLTGGEPLLHPRFLRLLEIVRRESLRLVVETNGLLCTPEIANEIARSPDRSVSVSIDGANAATHDGIRGVPGSFDAALRAVGHLASAGIRPQVIFTVMAANVAQADAVVTMAEGAGAASLKFNFVQPTARGLALHDACGTPPVADLIALGRRLEQEVAPAVRLKLWVHYPPAFRALRQIASPAGCGACGISGILGVLADGRYALCGIGGQLPGLVFGEAGKDALEAVWRENAVLESLREGLPGRLEGVCGRCLMKAVCLGSCIAQNCYRSGSLWAPNWFCEQAEAAGLFPASRLEAAGRTEQAGQGGIA